MDAVSEGLHVHEAAKVYVGTNISISTNLEAGDVIDGVTLTAGMRVLVNGQTTQSENGIYVVQSSGAALRATDFDTPTEISSGDFIFVSAGTLFGNTGWVQTNSPATIGTDAISFTQFSGAGTYTAGAGLTLTGTVFSADVTPNSGDASLINTNGAIEVKTDTTRGLSVDSNGLGINVGSGLTFNAGALELDTGFGVRKYSTSIGDGSTTAFTLSQSTTTSGVIVMINGVVQIPTVSYSVSGRTLTFTEAPLATDIIDARSIVTTATVTSVSDSTTSVTVSNAAGVIYATVQNSNVWVANTSTFFSGGISAFNANTSLTQNTLTTVDTFSTTKFRSAKYVVTVSDFAGSKYQTAEVLVVHNGTTAYATPYGVTSTSGSSFVTYSATISGSNVLLQANSTSAASYCSVQQIYNAV